MGPSTVSDSVEAQLQLCGFPEGQLDTSHMGAPEYLTSVGNLHLSQRVRVQLAGHMDRVTSVRWVTEPTLPSWITQRPAHVRFARVDDRVAYLEGMSLSRDEADFAYAAVTLRDGTSANAVVSVCTPGTWQPANQILVIP